MEEQWVENQLNDRVVIKFESRIFRMRNSQRDLRAFFFSRIVLLFVPIFVLFAVLTFLAARYDGEFAQHMLDILVFNVGIGPLFFVLVAIYLTNVFNLRESLEIRNQSITIIQNSLLRKSSKTIDLADGSLRVNLASGYWSARGPAYLAFDNGKSVAAFAYCLTEESARSLLSTIKRLSLQ